MFGPRVWPFQRATRANPCAISSISTSSGDGSSRSSRRPDSMRCQARGASLAREGAVPGSLRVGLFGNLLHGLVAVAGDNMVVDHADGLHEGIDDGRTAELEAALREFLRHRARCCGFRRDLPCRLEIIDLRLAVDEIPQQFRK